MKRLLIAPVLAGGLLLSSCATVPTGNDPITGTPIATEIANVQAAATQICAFVPTAATVAGILATFVPGVAPISTIVLQTAQSICGAVTAKSYRKGGSLPAVNGVPIHGRFLKHA